MASQPPPCRRVSHQWTPGRSILQASCARTYELPLPNAELAVTALLWRRGRLTSRDVIDELYPDATRPQHGTVQRLLQRLEDKGHVVRDRDLGVNAFTPIPPLRDGCARRPGSR